MTSLERAALLPSASESEVSGGVHRTGPVIRIDGYGSTQAVRDEVDRSTVSDHGGDEHHSSAVTVAAAEGAEASHPVTVHDVQMTRDKERRALTFALVFCVVFMVLELVGGYLSHSLAILTDALHLMTDVGSYALSIFALIAASQVATGKYSYGWHRAEVLGTLLSVFTIWALAGAITLEACGRMWTIWRCSKFQLVDSALTGVVGLANLDEDLLTTTKAPSAARASRVAATTTAAPSSLALASIPSDCVPIDSKLMIIVGVLGMMVNLGCACILYFSGSHGHSHLGAKCDGHGHSHDDHGHSHDDHGHSHDDHGHSHDDDSTAGVDALQPQSSAVKKVTFKHSASLTSLDHHHAEGDEHHDDGEDEEEDEEEDGDDEERNDSTDASSPAGSATLRGGGGASKGILRRSHEAEAEDADAMEEGCAGDHSHQASTGVESRSKKKKAAGSKKDKKKKKSGFAIHAAFLHALGDCVQSLGVILAGLFIFVANSSAYGTASSPVSIYNLADPLSSILFAVVTLRMTKTLIMDILAILMESTPQSVDYEKFAAALGAIDGVVSVHDLHVWSLTNDFTACSVHLVANNHVEVLFEAQRICESEFFISHHTIQVDPVKHGDHNCHKPGSAHVCMQITSPQSAGAAGSPFSPKPITEISTSQFR